MFVSFTDFDVDKFGKFVIEEHFSLQRINNIQLQPYTEIHFNEVVQPSAAQPTTALSGIPNKSQAQLDPEIKQKIDDELNVDKLKKTESLLPVIYKELYQKPKYQRQVQQAHRFIQYENSDVVVLRTKVANVLNQFQYELKQTLQNSNQQVPNLQLILKQKLDQLQPNQREVFLKQVDFNQAP